MFINLKVLVTYISPIMKMKEGRTIIWIESKFDRC